MTAGLQPAGSSPGRSPGGPRSEVARADATRGWRSPPRHGFTLIELLGAMLIVMFLMLLVFSSHRAMRRATQRRQAVVEARALVQAALAYRQVYGAWPLQDRLLRQPEYDEDIVVGDPATVQDIMLNQSNVVEVLRASGDLTLNPRRQVFLDVPDNRVASGGFMDPWGHAYVLLLDADGNGYTQTRVADLTGRRAPVEDVLNEPAAAFSWGEETGRITSWSESP